MVERGKKIIAGVESGGPYSSEIQEMKETFRIEIEHPLKKLSKENWGRYEKERYKIKQVFGSVKQKFGSSFSLIRKDLARKGALACAILWNFYMLVSSLIAYFIIHALRVCLNTCGIFRTLSKVA